MEKGKPKATWRLFEANIRVGLDWPYFFTFVPLLISVLFLLVAMLLGAIGSPGVQPILKVAYPHDTGSNER
jgi:hypothetical protein